MSPDRKTPDLAIVGGGIVGLVLAAGLVRRGIDVKVYEQARTLREVGAGIAFTANVVKCMAQVSPLVVEALRAAGSVTPSLDDNDPNAYFRWNDGYHQHEGDPTFQESLFTLSAGPKGWETVRRDLFLTELQRTIPSGVIELGVRVENIEQPVKDSDKVTLTFADGRRVSADAVIACDGIKSRTRQILLGPEDPASFPQYTHKVAYRTLIPAAQALQALGEYRARRLHFHVGPDAHLIHYPVNKDTIGAAVFVSDPGDWPHDKPFTSRGPREVVEAALRGWSQPVTELVKHFPAELEQWALFDMFEYPLSTYAYGRVCLAGDAAHGPSPHHGAGAGMGVEDALCLATLIEQASTQTAVGTIKALKVAFATFDSTRRVRTQWLVNSSRRVCDLYQHSDWSDRSKHIKAKTCFEEVKDRSLKIWTFDAETMVKDATTQFHDSLNAPSAAPSVSPVLGEWLVEIGDRAEPITPELQAAQTAYIDSQREVLLSGSSTGSVLAIQTHGAEEVVHLLNSAPFAKAGVWDVGCVKITPMKVGVLQPL